MENYLLDRMRSDRRKLNQLRLHLQNKMSGRSCIVMGSAPNPTVPKTSNAYTICVNGSVHSAHKYLGTQADLTFLNGAIFNNTDDYSNATQGVLENKSLGDVLIARNAYELGLETLQKLNTNYKMTLSISKYDKRVILAEACGRSLNGRYKFEANISNGLFMSAVALWSGAASVILAGFSFNSKHDYSEDNELSKRGHLVEDRLYLEHIVKSGLPIFTTEAEIISSFDIGSWPS